MKDCACGLLLQNGQVLLGKRSLDRDFYPGVWDLIGGHFEEGESAEDALVRELQEEIAVTPRSFRCVAVLREPEPERNSAHRYHVFLVSEWDGPGPRLRGKEHSEIKWFSIDAAQTLDLALSDYRGLLKSLVRA